MKNAIRLYHPDDTFVYFVERAYCKVFYQDEKFNLLIELDSNEELDHVEGDSLQNDFPQIFITLEDFPLENVSQKSDLVGKTFEVPAEGTATNLEGEEVDVLYTNLSASDSDYAISNNRLSFYENESGDLCMKWVGESEDFTEETTQTIRLEVECAFKEEKITEADD